MVKKLQFDVIIIGAGPAGLTLSWKLAEKNYRVLVIDRKTSATEVAYLTAGSFIDPARWGLPRNILQPIRTLYVGGKNQSVEISGTGFVINRKKLLKFLETKAKLAGAKIWYNTWVKEIKLVKGEVAGFDLQRRQKALSASAKYFADCSGIGCVLANRLGVLKNHQVSRALGIEYVVPLKTKPNTADLYVGSRFPAGYGWLFPLDNKKAILGCGTLDENQFKGLRQRLDAMFELPRVKERAVARPRDFRSGIFRTGLPVGKLVSGNCVFVGDVVLQGNPVVGEGVRFAMGAAEMAASALHKAIEADDVELLKEYERTWNAKYRESFTRGFQFQQLLRLAISHDVLVDEGLKRLKGVKGKNFRKLLKGEVSKRGLQARLTHSIFN